MGSYDWILASVGSFFCANKRRTVVYGVVE